MIRHTEAVKRIDVAWGNARAVVVLRRAQELDRWAGGFGCVKVSEWHRRDGASYAEASVALPGVVPVCDGQDVHLLCGGYQDDVPRAVAALYAKLSTLHFWARDVMLSADQPEMNRHRYLVQYLTDAGALDVFRLSPSDIEKVVSRCLEHEPQPHSDEERKRLAWSYAETERYKRDRPDRYPRSTE